MNALTIMHFAKFHLHLSQFLIIRKVVKGVIADSVDVFYHK